MHGCARRAEPALVLLTMLLSACSAGETDFGFAIESIDARPSRDGLMVSINQDLVFSREAREALENGVPLVIRTELRLRTASDDGATRSQQREYEIRFLPLSSLYQLSSGDEAARTFPRLRHVLAELSRVDITLPLPAAPASAWELEARSHLERRRLPPPMRLPSWFSARWKHDTGWQAVTVPAADRP